jgi:hypothetical protein
MELVIIIIIIIKLHNFGLSSSYVKWFQSYLSSRSSFVQILGKFSSSYPVLSGVPQGSTLGPLLFNVFINDLCAKINYSKSLLFANDLKIYRDIRSPEECESLQADIDSVWMWCGENHMELNVQKTRIISFTRKTNSICFNYFVSGVSILHTDCIEDLGVMLDSKLHFHSHVDYLHSQGLRTLGLIHYIMYNFSSIDSLVVLYNSLVRSRLEYASVIWNNLTLTDSKKLESIQRKFANLCHYRFPQLVSPRNYDLILNCINFRTLYSRRRHLHALFLINVFKGKINCHSIIDTVGIRVPIRQIRDFSTFNVNSALRHSPSARCASAANDICRFLDIFGKDMSPLRTLSVLGKVTVLIIVVNFFLYISCQCLLIVQFGNCCISLYSILLWLECFN